MSVASHPSPVIYRPDAGLTNEEDLRLRRLLCRCFPYRPAFRRRRYLHDTPPQHRWFIVAEDGTLAGHAAVYDKTILVGGREERIGGVAEVCVAPAYRGRGHLKALLSAVHAFLRREGIPFSLLFGRPELYRSSGYRPIAAPIRSTDPFFRWWNPFKGTPMVHLVCGRPWPGGLIDLCGPTF